jgi:FkbM family methyltransferase
MKKFILNKLYHIFLRYNYYYRELTSSFEPEMEYILKLVKKRSNAIDIGANVGIYTKFLSKYFQNIYAFEPIERAYKYIKRKKLDNVYLYPYALSNKNDTIELTTPIKMGVPRYGNSTLEKNIASNFENYSTQKIKTKKLDDFNIQDINLIKIDVEGHELEVIEGARDTIHRTKPVLLIEIDLYHLKNKDSFDYTLNYIQSFGYNAHFLYNNRLFPIQEYNIDRHHNNYINKKNKFKSKQTAKDYINNFFFLPK